MTSTLGDILLVFLADEPGTAYDLRQRHAQTFGPHRAVDITRVMSTLGRQERFGYVRAEVGAEKRSRPVCVLTEAGERRQRSWMLDLPQEIGEADVLDRVLLAVTATDRTTFEAVLGSCIAAMER